MARAITDINYTLINLIDNKLYWNVDGYTSALRVIAAEYNTVVVSTLDGLVTGEQYSFRVVSTNFIGDSLASKTLENVVAGSLPT
jgi:hypothetical protein